VTAESDPYAVLGVRPNATTATIAAAYRTLARRHHPDVSPAPDAEQRMADINAAWAILRDPGQRTAWDKAHAAKLLATAHEAGAAGRSASGRGAHDDHDRRGGTTWRRGPHGEGAAGPPPGNPRGSVLHFGRHIGWSLGEIARVDPGYLQWLATHRDGGRYKGEIEAILGPMHAQPEQTAAPRRRRGIFR